MLRFHLKWKLEKNTQNERNGKSWIRHWKTLKKLSKNIEVCEEPVPRTKTIPQCAVKAAKLTFWDSVDFFLFLRR